MRKKDELPDVHFGAFDTLDWRDPKYEDKTEDDDEELASTPKDVVAILGFDPLELDI